MKHITLIIAMFVLLHLVNHSFGRNCPLTAYGKQNQDTTSDSLFKSTTLTIFSEWGGTAYVDSQRIGRINARRGLKIETISPGPHNISVKVRHHGILAEPEYKLKFKDWEKKVIIEEGKDNSVIISNLINIPTFKVKKRVLYQKTEKFAESDTSKTIQKSINFINLTGQTSHVDLNSTLKYKFNFNSGEMKLLCEYRLKVDSNERKGEYILNVSGRSDWTEVVTIGRVRLLIRLDIKAGIACGLKLMRTDI